MQLHPWCYRMNPEKMICPCYKITKGDIIRAIENGATSFKEVKEILLKQLKEKRG